LLCLNSILQNGLCSLAANHNKHVWL
jgi:hypothetical protein